MVEVRGVEPLSESMPIRFSPSAFGVLGFPSADAPRRAWAYGSFIFTGAPQSLSVLVPRDHDVDGRIRGQFGSTRGITPRTLNRQCQLLFFPVLTRYRVRGSLTRSSSTPVETGTPPCVAAVAHSSRPRLKARSISRFASRSAAASRLSCRCLPLQSPISSFMRPSFK